MVSCVKLVALTALLCIIAAGAQACTLAGEPSQPAAWTLWNGGNVVAEVPFTARELGADCSLANPVGYRAGVLAWAEPSDTPRIKVSEAGTVSSYALAGATRVMAVAPGGPFVHAWVQQGGGPDRIVRINRTSHQVETVGPPMDAVRGWMDGAFFTYQRGDGQMVVYDLFGARSIFGPRELVPPSGPDARLLTANGAWIVWEVEDDDLGYIIEAYSRRSGGWAQFSNITASGWAAAGLDHDVLVRVTEEHLLQLHLMTGAEVKQAAPPQPFAGVVEGGTLVLGLYSSDLAVPREPHAAEPAPWALPFGLAVLALVGLAGLAALMTMRPRG
jgi:hypothetical protein